MAVGLAPAGDGGARRAAGGAVLKPRRALWGLALLAILGAGLSWVLAPGAARPTGVADAGWSTAAGRAALPAAEPVSLRNIPPVRPQRLPQQAADWDLCGLGRWPVPRPAAASGVAVAAGADGAAALPPALGAQATQAVLLRMLAALDAGDARARAAATVLRGSDPTGRDRERALAALSAGSPDPVVAMWAADRCQSARGCDDDLLQSWLDRDRGNAAVWLLWLQRHPAARAEALAGLSASQRFELYGDSLLAAALQAWPADAPRYLQPAIWEAVIGIESSRPALQYLQAEALCRAPLDATRQPVCAHLAELMAEHSDNAIARGLSARIGAAAGWTAERVQGVQAQAQAEQAALGWLADDQPLSCASVDALRAALRQRVQAAAAAARP
jgi:hypothetical protein